jgi:hypothetical protein
MMINGNKMPGRNLQDNSCRNQLQYLKAGILKETEGRGVQATNFQNAAAQIPSSLHSTRR